MTKRGNEQNHVDRPRFRCDATTFRVSTCARGQIADVSPVFSGPRLAVVNGITIGFFGGRPTEIMMQVPTSPAVPED
jgi:hypothetical protein